MLSNYLHTLFPLLAEGNFSSLRILTGEIAKINPNPTDSIMIKAPVPVIVLYFPDKKGAFNLYYGQSFCPIHIFLQFVLNIEESLCARTAIEPLLISC